MRLVERGTRRLRLCRDRRGEGDSLQYITRQWHSYILAYLGRCRLQVKQTCRSEWPPSMQGEYAERKNAQLKNRMITKSISKGFLPISKRSDTGSPGPHFPCPFGDEQAQKTQHSKDSLSSSAHNSEEVYSEHNEMNPSVYTTNIFARRNILSIFHDINLITHLRISLRFKDNRQDTCYPSALDHHPDLPTRTARYKTARTICIIPTWRPRISIVNVVLHSGQGNRGYTGAEDYLYRLMSGEWDACQPRIGSLCPRAIQL